MKKLFSLILIALLTTISLSAHAFKLTTTPIFDHDALPVLYTCDGKGISPTLNWNGAPKKTKAFAVIFSDPDAPNGTFYHWILYNIPKNVTQLTQGIEKLPAGTLVGKNTEGKLEYKGPCPPKGQHHNYVLMLYALNAPLNLPAGADQAAVKKAMKRHIIGKANLNFTYSRWLK